MRRLALVSIVLVLVSCSGVEPAGTSPPSTSEPDTTSTTEVTETSAAPSTTQPADGWDAIAIWRGGAAGDYRTQNFAVPLRFTTTSAWTGSEQIDNVLLAKGDSNIWILDMGFESIDDAIAHFQAMENAQFGEPTTGSIGGATSAMVDGTITGNQSITRLADGLSLQWIAGTETRVHVVDVDGDIVVILVDRTSPMAPGFAEQSEATLDSVVWKALEA